ncbi:MAG: segregation and condensation protein A [Lachnospiraceae bacterium]
MAISVKLEVFEGPLDLLLHLIDKNKIDIYDIPIVEITEQYLDYVKKMSHEDLAVVSEFMVMAATLIQIKCSMLLPREVNEEGEEEDPRAELVERLVEYKLYKKMSGELRDFMLQAEKVLYKKPTIPEEVLAYRPEADPAELLQGITLDQMNAIFQSILLRQEDKVDPIRSKFGKIEKEEVNLPEKIEFVRDYAKAHGSFSFRTLISRQASKMQVVVTFLAILELMKVGDIMISQESIFDDIKISLKSTD